MKCVGAGLHAHADHAAQELSELSAGIIGDDAEFLDRIDVGRISHVVVDELGIFHAIQPVVSGLFAVAVNIGASGVKGRLASVEGRGTGGDRARHQQSQLIVVARFERQTGDRVGLYHRADMRGLSLQQGRR